MPNEFNDLLAKSSFSPWTPLDAADSFPNEHVLYIIHVVGRDGAPISIQRARKPDDLGIVYIGAGSGRGQVLKLRAAMTLKSVDLWNPESHHPFMRSWLSCDFKSLPGFDDATFELAFRHNAANDRLSELQCELVWAYKLEFADLPIGNLKVW
jgi:hypothetical protein